MATRHLVFKRSIVWTMVLGRAVMCPLIALAAARGAPGWALALIVLLMLLDDIADGMVARRWELDTSALRLSDSCADTVFYLGTAVAAWLHAPQPLRQNLWLIVSLLALEALRYAVDLIKFRKAASYHSYLAKAWGLVLAAAIMSVLIRGGPAWTISAAATLGIVVNLDGFAMSLVLPHWQNDVKTLRIAFKIRADAKKAVAEAL